MEEGEYSVPSPDYHPPTVGEMEGHWGSHQRHPSLEPVLRRLDLLFARVAPATLARWESLTRSKMCTSDWYGLYDGPGHQDFEPLSADERELDTHIKYVYHYSMAQLAPLPEDRAENAQLLGEMMTEVSAPSLLVHDTSLAARALRVAASHLVCAPEQVDPYDPAAILAELLHSGTITL